MNRLSTHFLPVALLGLFCNSAQASDHREAPLIQEDITADLADVYAFLNPSNPNNLVLAMTVNPFSVPSEAITFNFSPHVRYRFNIDTNNDGVTDQTATINFRGAYPNQIYKAQLPGGVVIRGAVTNPTEEPAPNPPIIATDPSGARAFAGPRDDPFFFDVVGFNRFLAGTGSFSGEDGFGGFNVSAIVLELPLSLLNTNSTDLQVYAETARRRVTLRRSSQGKLATNFGEYEQVDRVGVPAINTALISPSLKNFYNIGLPQDDAQDFAPTIVNSLMALGTDATNIGILASVALPDTLKLDLTQPIGFPNGRGLADDVVDTLLFFIFNQTPVSDGVQMNDVPFMRTFPFLGAPTQAR